MMIGEKRVVTNEAVYAVQQIFLHSDPLSKKKNESIRRSIGYLEDLYLIWNNRPLYDASQITSPVLVIYGENDWFAEKDMQSQLARTTRKKEVVIPNATHWMVYEKNCDVLFKEVLNSIEMKEGIKK